jgi:hypothetical protein
MNNHMDVVAQVLLLQQKAVLQQSRLTLLLAIKSNNSFGTFDVATRYIETKSLLN